MLLTGDPSQRLAALADLFRVTSPAAPRQLEAALPDLLRDGDDGLLAALARALGAVRDDPSALRVLECLAGRHGAVRAAALRALRGEQAAAPRPSRPAATRDAVAEAPVMERTPPLVVAAASGSTGFDPQRLPGDVPVAAAAGGALGSAGEATWRGPFEAALADPTPARLTEAALALVELTGAGAQLPADAADLAGRLAMAALDQPGEAQVGLARLARGLRALARA